MFDEEERKELFKNVLNNLLLLKADILSALNNPYNMYSNLQKNVIETNLLAIEKLIGEIQ